MAAYQKAYISPCVDGRPSDSQRIAVQFNPSEIDIVEAVGSNTSRGRQDLCALLKQFGGHEIGRQWPESSTTKQQDSSEVTLSTKLFFNTLEDINQDSYEDVRNYVRQLYAFTNKITEENRGKNHTIEKICFGWGSIVIVGILTSMSVHYTMFAPTGNPVRAEVSITIVGDYYGEKTVNVKSSARGDWYSYGSIENKLLYFSDPGMWKQLAGEIRNPRDILPQN